MRRANFPTDKGMASLVNTGNLLNSPITSSDVHRATAIDGGVIPSEMGKGTKPSPKVLTEEPSTAVVNKDVDLECDIFFVDGHAFLLTLSNFGYGMAAYLGVEKEKKTRSGSNIWTYLTAMFAAYVELDDPSYASQNYPRNRLSRSTVPQTRESNHMEGSCFANLGETSPQAVRP